MQIKIQSKFAVQNLTRIGPTLMSKTLKFLKEALIFYESQYLLCNVIELINAIAPQATTWSGRESASWCPGPTLSAPTASFTSSTPCCCATLTFGWPAASARSAPSCPCSQLCWQPPSPSKSPNHESPELFQHSYCLRPNYALLFIQSVLKISPPWPINRHYLVVLVSDPLLECIIIWLYLSPESLFPELKLEIIKIEVAV